MYSISGNIRTVEHSLLTIARTQSSQAVGYFCMTPEGCGWACWGALRQGHWGHTFGGHHRTLLLKINEVDSIKWGTSAHTLLAVGNLKKAIIRCVCTRRFISYIRWCYTWQDRRAWIWTFNYHRQWSYVFTRVCLCVCVCVCVIRITQKLHIFMKFYETVGHNTGTKSIGF